MKKLGKEEMSFSFTEWGGRERKNACPWMESVRYALGLSNRVGRKRTE
jgi:hypothetical protein